MTTQSLPLLLSSSVTGAVRPPMRSLPAKFARLDVWKNELLSPVGTGVDISGTAWAVSATGVDVSSLDLAVSIEVRVVARAEANAAAAIVFVNAASGPAIPVLATTAPPGTVFSVAACITRLTSGSTAR